MLRLSDEHQCAIEAHGERGYPEEICGFLIGRSTGDEKTVETLLPIENIREENRTRRCEISPADFYHADRTARASGQAILGVYHSHPDHPARPSEYDREHAWPFYSYVIVAIAKRQPGEMTSWQLNEQTEAFEPQRIVVSDG